MSNNYKITNNRVDNINTFLSGDTLRFNVDFQVGEDLTDPTEIFVKFKNPNNSIIIEQASNIIHESLGKYYVHKTINLPGEWWIRWEATGAVDGVAEMSFRIIQSDVIG